MNRFTWRRVGRLVATAAVAATVAVPAAEADRTHGGPTGAPAPSPAVWTARGYEVDRLGPKHVALQHPVSPPPATVVKVVRPAGFDWGDASVGAGVAAFVLGSAAGLALLATRRRLRPV